MQQMVTSSDPINDASLIPRMQTLEPPTNTPQVKKKVVRNKDMVGPSGPKMQPEGNKEEFMTEEQEMEEYEAFKDTKL